MTGEQLFEHYNRQNSEYASIVKLLPQATESIERVYEILERSLKEKKRLHVCYPGIGEMTSEEMDKINEVEPIGPVIDGYLYLVSNKWFELSNEEDLPIEKKVGWGFGVGGFKLGYKYDVNRVIDESRKLLYKPESGYQTNEKLQECKLFLLRVKIAILQHGWGPNYNDKEKQESIALIDAFIEEIEGLKSIWTIEKKNDESQPAKQIKTDITDKQLLSIEEYILTDLQNTGFIEDGGQRPLNWLKYGQDLKMFVDTHFPNEKKKWVKTKNTFTIQGEPINIDSLKNLNPAYKDNPPSEEYFKTLKRGK